MELRPLDLTFGRWPFGGLCASTSTRLRPIIHFFILSEVVEEGRRLLALFIWSK